MQSSSVAGPFGSAKQPAKCRASSGSDAASTAPDTSVTGTRAAAARCATTNGAFASSVCRSVRPSPVIAQSAPASAASRPIRSATTAAPEANVPPTNCSAKPSPPAAPAPGSKAARRPTAASASAA